MAGFQQAANALTGSVGTVGGRVGVYNELVGKNKEMIKDLEKKNKEIYDLYTTITDVKSEAELELDAIHQKEFEKAMRRQERREAKKEYEKRIERRASIIDREWERTASHMSKNMMTAAMFGDLSSGSGGGI